MFQLVIGAYEQTLFRFAGGEHDRLQESFLTGLRSSRLPADRAGTEDAVFEPRFVSYGFRYLQMRLPSGVKLATAPDVSHFTCWAVHTELQTTGRFAFARPEDAAGAARDVRI